MVRYTLAGEDPYATVKLLDGVYFDQTEVTVASWLSYYTWILEHEGYNEAKKVLPDSNSIEPLLWKYISKKSQNYIETPASYSLQPVGYFENECKECTKLGKRLGHGNSYYCELFNLPVTGVTYEQVNNFCHWRTKVEGLGKLIFCLPTPEEWTNFAKQGLSDIEKVNNSRDSLVNGNCATYNYKIKCECDKDFSFGKLMGPALFGPNKYGAYDVFGNVSEMTSVKGISKGGNFKLYANKCHPDSIQFYTKPEIWLGFRCIAVQNNFQSKSEYNNSKDTISNFQFDGKYGEYTDSRDGKIYAIVKIGNQIWMSENLAYKPDKGKFWIPENNPIKIFKYGYLYNWETAQNVCPSGFHLPSKEEFDTLINNESINYLAMNLLAFGNSGFAALYGGFHEGINYLPSGIGTAFWTSTVTESKIWTMCSGKANIKINLIEVPKKNNTGNPVRCIKN